MSRLEFIWKQTDLSEKLPKMEVEKVENITKSCIWMLVCYHADVGSIESVAKQKRKLILR